MRVFLLALLALFIYQVPLYAKAPRSDRSVFVHLFEWTWNDIAKECENFLGPMGFAGVQVSPPNEHAIVPGRPWYERYQPVSYKLISRSGNRQEFVDMVRRCKAVGVDIYADAVINHMAWVNRTPKKKYGVAGSFYKEYIYQDTYGPQDFHRCGRYGDEEIRNYQDRWEVQNCNLAKLADLATGSWWVQYRLASYLNDLLDIGVKGFRIDAAKHMPTEDIAAILGRLEKPSYIFQEVIDQESEPIRASEYLGNGDVNEFKYGDNLTNVFKHGKLAWLQTFGKSWGMGESQNSVVFIDNHDLQRGHGAGTNVLTYKDGAKYALANVFMLAWPYGYPKIMSSYRFEDPSAGPPTSGGHVQGVYKNGSHQCGKDWVCEHRWHAIAPMVRFRNAAKNEPVRNWWSDGNNQIAFGRGDRAFVMINNTNAPMERSFVTGLPRGHYQDVLSTGRRISVDRDGIARVHIDAWAAAALHIEAKID